MAGWFLPVAGAIIGAVAGYAYGKSRETAVPKAAAPPQIHDVPGLQAALRLEAMRQQLAAKQQAVQKLSALPAASWDRDALWAQAMTYSGDPLKLADTLIELGRYALAHESLSTLLARYDQVTTLCPGSDEICAKRLKHSLNRISYGSVHGEVAGRQAIVFETISLIWLWLQFRTTPGGTGTGPRLHTVARFVFYTLGLSQGATANCTGGVTGSCKGNKEPLFSGGKAACEAAGGTYSTWTSGEPDMNLHFPSGYVFTWGWCTGVRQITSAFAALSA